jgi:diguanylate cyclase (GGDEF)-like protein
MDGAGRDEQRRGRAARFGAVAGAAAAGRVATLQKLVDQYRVLLETSAVISAETDIDEALANITRLVTERMDVAWCDIYDALPGGDQFVVAAYFQLPELGLDSSDWVGTVYSIDAWSDIRICAAERRAFARCRNDPEITEAEAADMDAWGELACLTVPLVYRGQLIGLIDVGETRRMRHFTDDDVRVLQAIADQAAIAMVNARTIKRLEEQAMTDSLTGLYNRRHLEERLRQEVAKARRYAQDLSVLMIDLDDLKRFNDTFGHPQGDKLLQELTGVVLAETRRDVDVVARYGGDELVVVMPLTPAGDEDARVALTVAERIKTAVGIHMFEGWPGRREEHVTVSVGVAGMVGGATPAIPAGMDALSGAASESTRAAAVLLTAADKALYLAKHQGRDRVCLFED